MAFRTPCGHFQFKVLTLKTNKWTGHFSVGHERRLQRRDGKACLGLP